MPNLELEILRLARKGVTVDKREESLLQMGFRPSQIEIECKNIKDNGYAFVIATSNEPERMHRVGHLNDEGVERLYELEEDHD